MKMNSTKHWETPTGITLTIQKHSFWYQIIWRDTKFLCCNSVFFSVTYFESFHMLIALWISKKGREYEIQHFLKYLTVKPLFHRTSWRTQVTQKSFGDFWCRNKELLPQIHLLASNGKICLSLDFPLLQDFHLTLSTFKVEAVSSSIDSPA